VPPGYPSDGVVIIGAGPVGLMIANLLGPSGIPLTVLEATESQIAYPRAVGIDDESLRTFQTAGLVDAVLPHVVPDQPLTFINGRGKVLARLAPSASDFGWPRRNGFVQPLADRVLLEGLDRFPTVRVIWGVTVTGFDQDDDGVTIRTVGGSGEREWRAAYLIGADGGSSSTRRAIGASFDGQSAPAKWVIVDLENDPLGRPGAFVGADPRRSYATMSIPHGIRRFEFMLKDGETEELATGDAFVGSLLERFVPDPAEARIIRRRVYTHHSRLASRFRDRRVVLAGDAAHVMPVFQGQGFNSGIRDAANLAWKLDAVLRGLADPALLDSYEAERRPHVLAMIRLSTLVGRFVTMRNPLATGLRDAAFRTLSLVPAFKRWIVEMRFKPMPTIAEGAVAPGAFPEIVGRLFIQPVVELVSGEKVRLDDAMGPWFALIAWNNDPASLLDPAARALADRLGVRLVSVRPAQQLSWAPAVPSPDVLVVGDVDGRLKDWFAERDASVLVVRPDRVIAGAGLAQSASSVLRDVVRAAHLLPAERSAPDNEST
jgi:3-(3-hydroxy-phenyl)propionate hydroxylase